MTQSTEILPNSRRLVEALRSIGYSLEGAIADVIDNSIAAGAKHVLVRLARTEEELLGVRIVDDGSGMPRERLEEAMRFGAETGQAAESLSKFGMGMKIASLSQATSLTVATRCDGQSHAMRWTVAGIADNWRCERLPQKDAVSLLDASYGALKIARHGTVVSWEHLDRIKGGSVETVLKRSIDRLRHHLGLHLHRFLEQGRLQITIDVVHVGNDEPTVTRAVEALDPFGYDPSATPYPERSFRTTVPGVGKLTLGAHTWPPNATSKNYKLDDAAKRQGIYFYRNDRLIQAGGWNGFRADAEPHLSLARVAVDLPPENDAHFQLDVQKASIKVPPGFIEALDGATDSTGQRFRQYVGDAQKAYRKKERQDPTNHPLVPGTGIATPARKKIREALAPDAKRVREVTFEWAEIEGGDFFRLDAEGKRIVLNKQYRQRILYGRPATATDAPLEKLLLFLLFRDDLDRERGNAKHQGRVDQINSALAAAMKKLDD
jgi:hypothetical protein